MDGDGKPVIRGKGPTVARFKYDKGPKAICKHHHRSSVNIAMIYCILFERFHAYFMGFLGDKPERKIKVSREKLMHAFVTSIREEPIEAELQKLQLFLQTIDLEKLQSAKVKDLVGLEYGNKEILTMDQEKDELDNWPEDANEVSVFSKRAGLLGDQSFIANCNSFKISKHAYDRFVSLIFPDERVADKAALDREAFSLNVVKSVQYLVKQLKSIVREGKEFLKVERSLSPDERDLQQFLLDCAGREALQTSEKLKVLTQESRSSLAANSSHESITHLDNMTDDTKLHRIRNAQTLDSREMPDKQMFAKETVKLDLNMASKRFTLNPTDCTYNELQTRDDLSSLLKLQHVSKKHHMMLNTKVLSAFDEGTLVLSDDYFSRSHAECCAAVIATNEPAYEVRKLVIDTNSLDEDSLCIIFGAIDRQNKCRSFTIRRARVGPRPTEMLVQMLESRTRDIDAVTELRLCRVEQLLASQTGMLLTALSPRYTQVLQLTGLIIGKEVIKPLTDFLEELKLIELDLSWAKITAKSLEILVNKMVENPEECSLKKLNLRGINVFAAMGAESKEKFCEWVKLASLKHLDMGWMSLGRGALPIISSLGKSVQSMRLEGNGIPEELLVKELGLTKKEQASIPKAGYTTCKPEFNTISSHVEATIQKSLRTVDKSEETLTIVRNPLPTPLSLNDMLPQLWYSTDACPVCSPSALVQVFYRRSNPKNWQLRQKLGAKKPGFPSISGLGKMVPVKAQAAAVKVVEENKVGEQANALIEAVQAIERGEGEGMLAMVGVWREQLIPNGLQPGLVVGAMPFDLGRPNEDDVFVWQGRVPEGRWRLRLTDPELGCEFEHVQDLIVFGDGYEHACVWAGDENLENQQYQAIIVENLFNGIINDYCDEMMAKVRHELPEIDDIQAILTATSQPAASEDDVNDEIGEVSESIRGILIAEQKILYKLYTYLDIARLGVRAPRDILQEILPEHFHEALTSKYLSGQARGDFVKMMLALVDKADPVNQLKEIVKSIRDWIEESPEARDITVCRSVNVLHDWAVADLVRAVDPGALHITVDRMQWLQAQSKSVTGEINQHLFITLAAYSLDNPKSEEPFLMNEIQTIDIAQLHTNLQTLCKVAIPAPLNHPRPRQDMNYYTCLQNCLDMPPEKALAQTRKLFRSFRPTSR